MASFSDFTENGVLNLLFSGSPFVVNGRYLALFTGSTGLEENQVSTSDEVSNISTGYTRVNIDLLGGFTQAVNGSISNVADMEFPIAASDWGSITHTAIIDSSAYGTGNVIVWGPLLNPRIIYTGDTIKVPAGALTITLQ